MKPSSSPPNLSFVIPVYGSPGSLAPLQDRIARVCHQLKATYEIILIDDRCPKGSWEIVRNLVRTDDNVVGVRLSRNFGQHAAISAGLTLAKGDWIVVMDCDLQDQPEDVPAMLEEAKRGGYAIVRARRSHRQDPLVRKLASRGFYMVLSLLTGTHQDPDIANFGIYNRRVINVLNSWQEESKYFPAIIEWVGFHQTAIEANHANRYADRSSYNIKSLIKLATNVVIGFSDAPLKLITVLGFLVAITSAVVALAVLYAHLSGSLEVQGWASVMISLWFLSGCTLFCMGLTGLYIGRILMEAKGRPTYVIDEIFAAANAHKQSSSGSSCGGN